MNKKILFILLMGLIIIPFVNAVPPFQTSTGTEVGLTLRTPVVVTLKVNETVKSHMHIFNSTNDIPIFPSATVECTAHLYDAIGNHILEQQMGIHENNIEYDLTILGTNFSEIGRYAFIIWCNSTEAGGFTSGGFDVTTTGEELTQPMVTLNLGLIFIIFLFFILILVGMFKLPDKKEVKDNGEIINRGWLTYIKPILFMFAYALLMAIMFISSGVALNYLTFTALGKILFVTYQIMMYLLLPLIFGWLIWIFVSIFQDNEMKKMLERGGDDFGDI